MTATPDMATRVERQLRCPTWLDNERCDYRGTPAEIREHAADVGHPVCRLCDWPLRDAVEVVCGRCVQTVRDDLAAVNAGCDDLERRLEDGAYSGGWLVALAMLADGALYGGGEDDHVRYRDPIAVAAWLEWWDRDWREEFGHRRPSHLRLGHPDRFAADVRSACSDYLRTWLWLAARTHPEFAGFAEELAALRSKVEHVALLVADPESAPVPCACGGRLEQRFGENGRSDDRVCRACGTRYDPEAYLWRYRMVTEAPGWVSVHRAADAAARRTDTVWRWVRALEVPSACQRLTRRTVVDLAAVLAKSEQAPAQVRRRSA